MRCLNSSYKVACLQCSFSDKEVAEYIQFKKRGSTTLPKKYAVVRVGKQDDSTWVFASNIHLSSAGKQLSSVESRYIWIGHVFMGQGVACDTEQCTIELPLMSDPLCTMMTKVKQCYGHNFFPCVLTMASSIIALHYTTMLKKIKSCPVPLAFGNSGTGKTTALLCGLALFGAHNNHFYCKITKQRVLQLCASTAIPVGVDDPQSKNEISRLMIDLYQGAKNSSITHGCSKPSTTCIISSNFPTVDQQQ